MINTVNPDNFNETCKRYLVSACRIVGLTEKEKEKIFDGLRWAFDEMTKEQAREEYKNRRNE